MTEGSYRPFPDGVTVAKSDIHGVGLFATKDMADAFILGVSHILDTNNLGIYPQGYIRTPIGGLINHADDPNCVKINLWRCPPPRGTVNPAFWPAVSVGERPLSMGIRTDRAIEEGEELTIYYTLY